MYPLSYNQRSVWFYYQLAPESFAYNFGIELHIRSDIDVKALQCAIEVLTARHQTLRTTVSTQDGEPMQIVRECQEVSFEETDASNWDWEELNRRVVEAYQHPFDIERRPVLRVSLFSRSKQAHILLLVLHHIAADAFSLFKLLVDEFGVVYQAEIEGAKASLPALNVSYTDFVQWQTQMLASPKGERLWAYWQKQLADANLVLNLPTDRPRPPMQTYKGASYVFKLNQELTFRLRELAQAEKATLYMILLAAFQIMLYRYTDQEDILLGFATKGRSQPKFANIIGHFVNPVVLRASFSGNPAFKEFLAQVRHTLLGAITHQDYPFPLLVERLLPERDHSRSPIIQALFVLQIQHQQLDYEWAAPDPEGIRTPVDFGAFKLDFVKIMGNEGQFDLTLDILEGKSSISAALKYNTDLFDAATIARMAGHYQTLLEEIVTNPQKRVSDLPLLTEAELDHLLVEWNDTQIDYPRDRCINQLFEAQVERTPDAVAVVCEKQQLTYRELNARANQLAHYLQNRGIGPEVLVAICIERSVDMLVAIWGILKAGGAYVPIEPSYPTERIVFIIEDTQAPLLLTQASLRDRLPNNRSEIVQLDADWAAISREPQGKPVGEVKLDQLAYIMYTSGSTGQPKGVAIPHGGLVNYASWAKQQYCQDQQLAFPLFSPLSFDLTVTSIFVPLISGGRVVIYGEAEGPIDLSLRRVIQENAVDIIKLTPAHLSLIQDMNLRESRVRKLILGGDDLKTALARTFKEAFSGNIAIYNEYGPTEATVGCMIYQFDPETDVETSVPIGKPAARAQIYLLDSALNLVPQGVVGEIFIGGPGLARGYLNRPELTAERFIDNPFHPGERLYRTGDLGRWAANGQLQYLGRHDRQVKIRGTRIELGEVETSLSSHPQIEACVVNVVRQAPRLDQQTVTYCTRCGLASNYPGTSFDTAGVCNFCRAYENYKHRAQEYFKNLDELRAIFEQARQSKRGEYDCLMLLSGGKDSTYVLCQLVAMGLKVLAFTLDNGYISEQAKANIRRVVQSLNVDHVFGSTPAMNAIFVDSLKRHCNVCNGCFKTIYTLSMKLAYEKGIPCIVTGLSRGQFFETRLTEELFTQPDLDVRQIDQTVLEARKTYHRVNDAVSQLLDVEVFQNDEIFEQVQVIDFYRYCDVGLDEMLAFLSKHVPWIRPSDTGRSTNCLINNVGIHVHTQKQGYHNYALPYSWDVRMGHKTREAALEELNDDIDVDAVKRILQEIGYQEGERETEQQLAAYYVSDNHFTTSELRTYLAHKLPSNTVPAYFIKLDCIPLTANGKVDYKALPHPEETRPELDTTLMAPTTSLEKTLAKIWEEVLRVNQVGIYDNFFELGGHSLLMFRIHSKISEILPQKLSIIELFQYPTIHSLANHLSQKLSTQLNSTQGHNSAKIRRNRQAEMEQQRQRRQKHHSINQKDIK